MAKLSQWMYDQYVQAGMTDGQFLNAAYTLVAAGPPRLANMGGTDVLAGALNGSSAADNIAYPLGLLQSFQLGNNGNLSRFFEIGSERSYFMMGRVMGGLSLSRVMYHGPSLLRVMYAYYQDLLPPTVVQSMLPGGIAAAMAPNAHDVLIPPGYENVYLNLASDLFKQPVGLLLMMKDSNWDSMASYYFESVYVPNHNISVDAMGGVFQEGISAQYERMLPIKTRVVGLMTGM